jgi:FkbM family methyltransferase
MNKINPIRIIKNDVVLNVAHFGVDDINNFWVDKVQNGNWEDHTFKIFDKYKDKGKVMIDFGGWIGITPLYSADKFEQVVAFECDKHALERFKANLIVNPQIQNVTILEQAIWKNNGTLKIGHKADGSYGDSESSVFFDNKDSIEVECATLMKSLDHLRIHPRNVGFIKMDIEGSEYEVIESIKNFLGAYKPTLYLSIHHHLLTERQVYYMLSELFSIYANCCVYDAQGKSFNVTRETIINNRLLDCLFTNKPIKQ